MVKIKAFSLSARLYGSVLSYNCSSVPAVSVTPFAAEWLVLFRLSKDFLNEAMAPVFVPAHIRLSQQQRGLLFNTLCLSPTQPSLHVPAGLTQTKPTQRGPIRLASQLWQRPAKGPEPAQQISHIL